MAGLSLISITCNRTNTLLPDGSPISGGPIELRAPINSGPAIRIWGPQQIGIGETIFFNNFLANQQSNPIIFFNPIWIELWDTGEVFQTQKVDETGNIAPGDSDSSFTFMYLGGEYTLKYSLIKAAALVALN